MELLLGVLAEILGGLVIQFIIPPIFYPFGLLRLWIIAGAKNAFLKIIRQHSFRDVASQGHIFMLDLLAAAGALSLSIMLLAPIGVMIWTGVKAIFH
jgi:hypothetical protein